MSDILFIKTSSLGDVIHHMPAVTDARRHRPQARIGWVVEEAFAPLVRLHRGVDDVIPVASRRWRAAPFSPATWREFAAFRQAMGRQTHETVIDAQGLLRSGLVTWLARGRKHGYDRDSVRERAAAWFYDAHHSVDRSLHAITRNRMLTGQVLGYAPEGPPEFGLDRAALSDGVTNEAVLLHATARSEKEWPTERWIALGQALAARGQRILVPWGNETERRRSTEIAAAVPNAIVPELQPLDQVARMIARAAFVVGVDTGLLHLAAALGVPLVAIFVGTQPGQHGPLGSGRIEVVGALGEMPSVEDVGAAVGRIAR